MLHRYFLRLLALLLGLAATGCAPTYLLGVQPARPNTLLASDYSQAEASADSVYMALRFVGYEASWLVFEAEYHNEAARPVLVDPTGFAQVPVRQAGVQPLGRKVVRGERVPAAHAAASQRRPWPSLPPAPLPALNPEPAIGQLQARADGEAAKASRPDWLGLALFAVALGTDVAGAVRSHETAGQYQARAAIHDMAWSYNAISTANHARHALTADELARQAARLRDYALRPVQLLPGQQVRGYVYLPRFDEADGLRVLVPVGRQQVPLDFVQVHQRR